jgi:hypothetical protein
MNTRGLIQQITRLALTGAAAALILVASGSSAQARQWARPATAKPPCTFPRPNQTPEVDPGALRGALTLLGGGVLAFTDRKRRR